MRKSGHEDYTREETNEGPSNRSFGLTVGGILLGLGVLRFLWHGEFGTFTTIMLLAGGPLVLAAFLIPNLLTPLNKAWMALGLLLSKIVSPIVMFLIFCIAFIPTAMVLKIRGYDPMRAKVDPNAKTHWIKREPAGPNPDDMINQF
ncbi:MULTISPECIES: SxtJ family membrane protein [Halocynthiibacter]|uniref:SxtJ family membrane protein n=1 Tax=Halocynthiibacter halioticoli TaxID=2986804 RepID=A0AAE3LUR5_9RHOB|nr:MULTISPECIES: SxtJ family membrane protein [Halocynthiibacter]MCV6825435.1 SxtJ family membrane protein [Halocynthiibacter halioticoli]MCW4058436.1 SxtJ family membrane protein [Halocynthiibacter sp. SDUM655004]